ncbi:MAG: metallophosphoesterase, partial [Candidatus Eisenbacteria bacterium]
VALERASFALRRGLRDEAAAGLATARARLPHDRALAETATALGGIPPTFSLPIQLNAGFAPDAIVANATLLPRGSSWGYSATGAEPPGWAAPAYADAAWPSGPAALGFGEPFIVTSVPMGPDTTTRYWTTYFRTSFALAEPPSSFGGLTLHARYDDGFVARLNGVEIARRGLPAGPIVYTTPAAQHEPAAFEAIDVSAAGLAALVAGTNVLAVEVHQATNVSSDLAWDGELVGATGAVSVTRGPYLQNATPEAITVRWRTSIATDTRAWLGAAPGALAVAASDTSATTEHEVRLTGLAPESANFYAVGTTAGFLAGDDSAHAFVTPPPPGNARATRIWVLGDSGLPGAGQDRVRDAYTAYTGATRTDVWLMLGDNAYHSGTDGEYTTGLFAPYAGLLRAHCLWPTRGNHDFVYSGAGNDYYDHFTLPTAGEAGGTPSSSEAWYAFDHAAIHFVCLDSEGSSLTPGSPMLTWLAADLAANDQPWVIAYWHHPPYTKGSHDSDNAADSFGKMRDMRENVMPILESYGVDLVLNGHSHSYERSFLLDGHYGTSATLLPSMLLDAGDGSPDGEGAYRKPGTGPAPREGEVVAVAGSSAQISGGTLDHPAMFRSLNVLGSMVIDVDDDRLRAVFLDDLGAVRDSFEIRKGSPVAVPGPGARGAGTTLRVAGPNPSSGGPVRLAFELPRAGQVALSIVDAAGRRVRELSAGRQHEGGPHTATWDGRDEGGRGVPAGLYFALL